ncbi:MAG: NAD+ synthase [Rickettsiales bacterium]|nr:NAD+ synthase [Rickettsiales bacterium]
MRVALAQLNSLVGDVRGNAASITKQYRQARALGAELVVFPELALVGYPPRDLVDRPSLWAACKRELRSLAELTRDGGAILLGTLTPTQSQVGRAVFNSAVLLEGGRELARVHKSLLPSYDVFDEARYFEPARPGSVAPIAFRGHCLGVTICEDVWNDADFWERRLYDRDPAQELVDQGADLLINLSASPYHLGKQGLRHEMLSTLAQGLKVPVLHCNLVGGNDELIFDGASFACWSDGSLRAVAACFAEDLLLLDTEKPGLPIPPAAPLSAPEGAARALTLGVADYFSKCGFERAVVGLSGGIDSAVTAALAVRALGADQVTGITMPSRYSSSGSIEDSRQLAEALGIEFHVVPIESTHRAYQDSLSELWKSAGCVDIQTTGLADQNLQARIRGNLLMAWSNRRGALVLSTGNKSELAVGYCTLYGDMAGGLAVISDLPKTLVYEVANWLNCDGVVIPQETINKPPSAELAPDQLDTDSLPPYPVLDAILNGYIEQCAEPAAIAQQTGIPSDQVEAVVQLVNRNEFKRRQAAPGLRVTSKAFGSGRRFPVAARFGFD